MKATNLFVICSIFILSSCQAQDASTQNQTPAYSTSILADSSNPSKSVATMTVTDPTYVATFTNFLTSIGVSPVNSILSSSNLVCTLTEGKDSDCNLPVANRSDFENFFVVLKKVNDAANLGEAHDDSNVKAPFFVGGYAMFTTVSIASFTCTLAEGTVAATCTIVSNPY